MGKAKRREDSSEQPSASVFENSEEMQIDISTLLNYVVNFTEKCYNIH